MFKRIIILVDVILISVIFSSMQLFNNKNILDNSTIAEELFDKEEDIDNYLIGIYSNNTNFELITEQTYGNLSTLNVSQSALKEKYNDLTFMYYDLNGDGIINENENAHPSAQESEISSFGDDLAELEEDDESD